MNSKEVEFRSSNCLWANSTETCKNTLSDALEAGNNHFLPTVKTTVTEQRNANAISILLTGYKDGACVEVCKQGSINPFSDGNSQGFFWDNNEFNLDCETVRELESLELRTERPRLANESLSKAIAERDAAAVIENFAERIKNMS